VSWNLGSNSDCKFNRFSRSDKAWKLLFAAAELTLVHEKIQRGLPLGLYIVKM